MLFKPLPDRLYTIRYTCILSIDDRGEVIMNPLQFETV